MKAKDSKAATPKKNKGKARKGGFVGFLVFAFVLIVAANVIFSSGSRMETTIVRHGSEEDSVTAEGYFFREQTVMTAPTDGYIYCEAAEDQRVSLGEVVMYIYKNQVNLSASNELKAIEEKIRELSDGFRISEVYSSDTAKLEQTISQSLRIVPKAGARGDMQTIAEISETVNSLIEKRRIISGEQEPADQSHELEELKAQKAQLEKEYNIERTMVHAPNTGAFTSKIDGLEEKLQPSALDNISHDYLKELSRIPAETKTPERVAAGDPIGKIVNNFSWSVAALVDKNAVEGLSVGDSIGIRLPDAGIDTVSGTVSKICDGGSGKVILVANTNKYIDMIYSTSKATVEFVRNSYDGFRIPAKSLRVKDGVTGVYVIRSNKARFIPVKLLYNAEDWVVVAEITESAENPTVLKLYDELIISGKDIFDDKVVR